MRKGWKEIYIKDIGEVVTGNTPPRKNPELYGSHTIFIKPTDITKDKKYCYESEECYSLEGFKKYKKSLIPKDSTCVVTIGSIGEKIIIAHEDLFLNQAMNAVIPSEDFDKHFIYYLLKFNLFQLKTFDSGTASGRENVSKSSFSNIKVTCPISKNTQQKIAGILSDYDDLIENNLNRIKLLEEKVQIIYEEWFVRMKFPDHENILIDKETGLPEGWSHGKISDLIGFQSGFAFKSNRFITSGFPVIKIKNIGNGTVNTESTDCIDSDYAQQVDNYKLIEGDLLIAMTGATVGKVGVVPITSEPCYLNQRVGRFQAKGDIDNMVFVKSFFTIGLGLQHIMNYAKGAAQPNISASEILLFPTVIPSDDLLKKYSYLSQKIVNLSLNLQNQNRNLKEARDILLPRLMMGIVEV